MPDTSIVRSSAPIRKLIAAYELDDKLGWRMAEILLRHVQAEQLPVAGRNFDLKFADFLDVLPTSDKDRYVVAADGMLKAIRINRGLDR